MAPSRARVLLVSPYLWGSVLSSRLPPPWGIVPWIYLFFFFNIFSWSFLKLCCGWLDPAMPLFPFPFLLNPGFPTSFFNISNWSDWESPPIQLRIPRIWNVGCHTWNLRLRHHHCFWFCPSWSNIFSRIVALFDCHRIPQIPVHNSIM